jgi:alkylation response protein AidB-like acyl-CoA dehydrogenase
MTLQTVQSAITTIVAPVVMVTACAILVGGMLTQYGQMNDRLRSFAKERLNLLRTDNGGVSRVSEITGAYAKERLLELDTQLPRLLQRYQHVRNAVLTMYSAVLLFMATMLAIGLAYGFQSAGWAFSALALFLMGIVTMLAALVQHALYVLGGNVAVVYETRRILELGR